jgi:hypothetical protein
MCSVQHACHGRPTEHWPPGPKQQQGSKQQGFVTNCTKLCHALLGGSFTFSSPTAVSHSNDYYSEWCCCELHAGQHR